MNKLEIYDDKQQYFQEVRNQFGTVYQTILNERKTYFQNNQFIEAFYLALVKLQNVSAVFEEKEFYHFSLVMLKLFDSNHLYPKVKKGQEPVLLQCLIRLLNVLHDKKPKSDLLADLNELHQNRQQDWKAVESRWLSIKQTMASVKASFFQDEAYIKTLYRATVVLQKTSSRHGDKNLGAMAAFLLHQFQSETAVKTGWETTVVRTVMNLLKLLAAQRERSQALTFVLIDPGKQVPAVFCEKIGEVLVHCFVYSDWIDPKELLNVQPDFITVYCAGQSSQSGQWIELVRQRSEFQQVPVLAAATDEHFAGMIASGADYLLSKPVSYRSLLVYGVALLEKTSRKKTNLLALHAEQKREWTVLAEKEWDRFARFGSSFCMLYIQFANVNEEIIAQLPELYKSFQSILRKYDEIKWIGSDEMMVLLPSTNLASGKVVASRFLKLMDRHGVSQQAKTGVMESERVFGSVQKMISVLKEKVGSSPVSIGFTVFPLEQPALSASPEKIKVLLIDDDPFSASLIANYLPGGQWEVEICAQPKKAIKQIGAFQPHVILCETKMRDLDGFLLCRQVRQQPALAGVKFFFLTGQSLPQYQLRAYEAGADDYIVKPFPAEALQAKMKRAVQ